MIGYLEVEGIIYNAQSLKAKRSTLKKVITRIQNHFNVSVSELDYQDLWQRTCIGVAHVSSDKVQAERVLQEVIKVMDSVHEFEITNERLEWY
ncbi:DUF503 domain-containing protein [Salinibacillus xinjiangensis]|uniref:DUF503 family protein n=1 Tax=Salinibacillus xinjiangensis TaxID=1229268 RepID=A0A6G1X378_9BACI|nr:DUF503 domain-containing protein [Salinibacillus xinjiangensis]MRG85356.1 DUF503 family protein [Salinibacillus xinjiangensis]